MLQNKDNRPLDYLLMTQLSSTLPKTIRASESRANQISGSDPWHQNKLECSYQQHCIPGKLYPKLHTERQAPPVCSKSSTSLRCLSVALIDFSRYSASTITQTQFTISIRSSYVQRKTGMNYLLAAHSSVPPLFSSKLFYIPNLLPTWKKITDLRAKSFSSHSWGGWRWRLCLQR